MMNGDAKNSKHLHDWQKGDPSLRRFERSEKCPIDRVTADVADVKWLKVPCWSLLFWRAFYCTDPP